MNKNIRLRCAPMPFENYSMKKKKNERKKNHEKKPYIYIGFLESCTMYVHDDNAVCCCCRRTIYVFVRSFVCTVINK